jgi:hypothetical protein
MMREFTFQLADNILQLLPSSFITISWYLYHLLWSDICLLCSHICSGFTEKIVRCNIFTGASSSCCIFLYGNNALLILQTLNCLMYFSCSSRYISQDYMEHSAINIITCCNGSSFSCSCSPVTSASCSPTCIVSLFCRVLVLYTYK